MKPHDVTMCQEADAKSDVMTEAAGVHRFVYILAVCIRSFNSLHWSFTLRIEGVRLMWTHHHHRPGCPACVAKLRVRK